MTRNVGGKISTDASAFGLGGGLEKNFGPSAQKKFSRSFFFLARPCLVRPYPTDSKKFPKILALGENVKFRSKFRFVAKISDFRENLGFWRRFQISAKILALTGLSKSLTKFAFWRKSGFFAKISDFGENFEFRRKSDENLGFRRKSRISMEIKDLAENFGFW